MFIYRLTEPVAVNAAACMKIPPRQIGAWTHRTTDDIPAF